MSAFFLEILRGERKSLFGDFLINLLVPFSWCYRWGFSVSQIVSKLSEKSLPVPTICVGAIVAGGAGKTPIVIALVEYIRRKGLEPAVLSRGYARLKSGQKSLVVSNGLKRNVSWHQAGDEPTLLAQKLSGIPIVVNSNRFDSGQTAVSLGANILILDDGFQHREVKRDLDIVCVDAVYPYGNGHLLPAGVLRELPCALSRAGLVVLTKCNLAKRVDLEILKKEISKSRGVSVVHFDWKLKVVSRGRSQEVDLSGKKVLALSGIGDPLSFEKMLSKMGAEVVHSQRFPDHHVYRSGELLEIEKIRNNFDIIVTTEKDIVRLPENFDIDVCVLDTEIWEEDRKVWDRIIGQVIS